MKTSKSFIKTPYGAVTAGSEITVEILSKYTLSAVLHVKRDDGEEIQADMTFNSSGRLSASFCCDDVGLYFYAVEFPGRGFAGYSDAVEESPVWFQQTVFDPDYIPAAGFAGGIMYQIFPDRFNAVPEPDESAFPERVFHRDKAEQPNFRPDYTGKYRNNDFYGGTFKGIEEKLDYISSLNVTVMYLNPIFQSCSNHRYDTFDYMKPDPLLGTADDFASLCKSAGKKGIKIILDGVFSHTGADSRYFDELDRFGDGALHHRDVSPYASWFVPEGDKYHYWWGFENLPEVNELDPAYSEFITGEGGVIDYWLGLGASGFRLDVADELPDEFIEKIYKAVKRHGPDTLLIGEVWEDASNKISYNRRRKYFYGYELDGVMNYPERTAVIDFMRNGDGEAFLDAIASISENYPEPMMASCMNPLSTHDTSRIITTLVLKDPDTREEQSVRFLSRDEYLKGVEMFKLACAIQFAVPGIPCIYYGDEIGMTGFRDPFNRGYFRWDSPDYNVFEAVRSITEKHAQLSEVLAHGSFEPKDYGQGYFSFVRRSGDKSVLFAVNISESDVTFYEHGQPLTLSPWTFYFDKA